MPIYEFRCAVCSKPDEAPFQFTKIMPFSRLAEGTPCPQCNVVTTESLMGLPAVHMNGLTAAEKSAGTTRNRKDMGAFMKDSREKRKRAYGPGTREGDSNELWAGTLPDGIKAPSNTAKKK